MTEEATARAAADTAGPPPIPGLSPDAYRALFEASPDGIVIADQDGTILGVNPQAGTLFGYDPEELIGEPVEVLVPESLRSGHRAHRRGYVHDPHTRPMGVDLELLARRKDGSALPVEISLSPLAGADGVHVIATVRDVTERKRLREFGAGALRAAEDERRRIARELHDDTAQRLATVLLRLELAQRAPDEERRRALLAEAHDEIVDAAEGVRRIARGLRPPALEDAGVVTAIRSHARGVQEGSHLPVEVDADPAAERLDEQGKLVLYRVIQEALNNAIRHARPSRVHIAVRVEGEVVVAVVEDDGRGFDVPAATRGAGGLGLLGMRERAALVGGRVRFESAPEEGTRVEVRIPVETRERRARGA